MAPPSDPKRSIQARRRARPIDRRNFNAAAPNFDHEAAVTHFESLYVFWLQLDTPNSADNIRKDAFLFGESPSRVVVSIDNGNKQAFEDLLSKRKTSFHLLGTVTEGDLLVDGELLTKNSSSVNIGKGIAKYYNLKVGDTLIFVGQGYHGMQAVGAFPVCGILDMKNPNLNNVSVFMSLPTAQDFLSANDLMTHLVINKKEYSDEQTIVSSLSENFKAEYEIMTWQEMMPEIQQVIQADSAGGLVMIFILYMIITFGIFGTVLMMTQERKYEFGVVVSIGMKKIKLMISMVYETIFLTSIGVLTGVVLSRPLVIHFHNNPLEFPAEQAEMMENQGFEAIIPFMSSYDIPITHGLIIFFISLFICIYPIITIYKLNPVKAMKR